HTRLQGDWSSDVCSSDLAGSVPLVSRPWPRGILTVVIVDPAGSHPANSTSMVVLLAGTISPTLSGFADAVLIPPPNPSIVLPPRSEERRVGKECRSRCAT